MSINPGECVICLESLASRRRSVTTEVEGNAGHSLHSEFHFKCVARGIAAAMREMRPPLCPLCKKVITVVDGEDLFLSPILERLIRAVSLHGLCVFLGSGPIRIIDRGRGVVTSAEVGRVNAVNALLGNGPICESDRVKAVQQALARDHMEIAGILLEVPVTPSLLLRTLISDGKAKRKNSVELLLSRVVFSKEHLKQAIIAVSLVDYEEILDLLHARFPKR